MTEWLLSGHNTQETTGVARPVTVSMTEHGLNAQIRWFLGELAGNTSDFDNTLPPTVVVQGRLYLNIDYYARNMASVMPFEPASIGVPPGLVTEIAKPPLGRSLLLPLRFYRVYNWTARFYKDELPTLNRELMDTYWYLRETDDDVFDRIHALFEPAMYDRCRSTDRAHIVAALTITALDGVLRDKAPALLELFVGQATATSMIGQRVWKLRELAEQCGPTVTQKLRDGIVDLAAYEKMPEAAPFVEGVRDFLHAYGHRGFRYEADFETERLADRPEHILLAVAGQLGEKRSPEKRAQQTRQKAQRALAAMNPLQRALWKPLLKWGQNLISWRERSKSNIALRQAVYGLAARHLSRRFYPGEPDDTLMFYRLDEFIDFVQSEGEKRVARNVLDRRRAELELHQTHDPPPEMIYYDPDSQHWRPAVEQASEEEAPQRFDGIPASAGTGPVEGVALVTNDPIEAGQRLLELQGDVILITHLTDPAWSSLFAGLSGVVTELGGVISHAAIVARENGLPAVVGVPDVTRWVRNGQRLRIDGATGVVEIL